MKTKHIVSILSLMLVILLGIYSCKKEQGINSQPVSFAEKLAADESFEKLNNAMDRLDPQYVSIVYHDARTPKQIADASIEILKKLGADPNNLAIQKELAGFYHFNSFREFTMYSTNISEGIKELNTKFNFTKEVIENKMADEFVKARGLYAKKMYNTLKDKQSGQQNHIAVNATGTNSWEEYADEALAFFKYLMSEGVVGYVEEGGGGDCSESCCLERETCKSNAKSKHATNLWIYGIGGAGTGSAAGTSVGSIVPFWGTIVGGIGGIIWGAAGGIITANYIYQQDLEACNSTYKACIQKKNGN